MGEDQAWWGQPDAACLKDMLGKLDKAEGASEGF